MEKTFIKTTGYRCIICKTVYNRRLKAKRCELKGIEKKLFKKDDSVCNKEQRVCGITEKPYRFRGKIVKIIGPMPPDYEYETKWLGGKAERLNNHVYEYEVKFSCPHCGQKKRSRYYAPELERL